MTFFQLDVTNEEQVAQVIEQTVAKFGKLDSIVNNSGISLGAAPLADTETDEFKQQLIQQHLIAQARHRLTTTTDTVSQIAYALGFEYPQYFSRLFKKQTGHTPQEFRAQA